MRSNQRTATTGGGGIAEQAHSGAASIFRAVRPRRLSDGTIEQILELIRSGQLTPGTRLPPERELVTRLSVSRTSLREAIRILEAMGVLRVVPGRGTWVRDETPSRNEAWLSWLPRHRQDVMQLLEMRETLEVKAAALAAERGSAEQLAALPGYLESMKAAVAAGDREALVLADTQLHDAIAEASGNQILAEVLASLSQLVMETRRAIMSIPGRPARVVAQHVAVVQAICSRDPRQAARAMFQHVRRAEEDAAAAASIGLEMGDSADTYDSQE